MSLSMTTAKQALAVPDGLPRASCSSLPKCLRHSQPQEALDDARGLVAFLQDLAFLRIVAAENGSEASPTFAAARGLSLVTDLLADKLDIAAGVYHFPCIGGSEAPPLASREEWET